MSSHNKNKKRELRRLKGQEYESARQALGLMKMLQIPDNAEDVSVTINSIFTVRTSNVPHDGVAR